MAAVYVSNIVINTGADFSQTFNLANSSDNSALNLTGYGVSSRMRKYSSSSTSYGFNVSIASSSEGTIAIGMSATAISQIKPGRYIYDIVIVSANSVKTRVVEGMALVREGATN
jgi:hypothetical protein